MFNTSCKLAVIAADVLSGAGLSGVVLSPGSRNAMLCHALKRRCPGARVVIDERSAAFIALGMAEASERPAVMCCTSGTAPLNYAPAIAEAYYSQVPLIALTADRPRHMIDRLDGQTIHQPGIYHNYIKGEWDVSDESDAGEQIAEAYALAMAYPRGPVHINIRIDLTGIDLMPAYEQIDLLQAERVWCHALPRIDREEHFSNPGEWLAGKQYTMIVVGAHRRDARLSALLERIARRNDCLVVCPPTAATRPAPGRCIAMPDITFALDGLPRPDMVLSIGGEPLSAPLKSFLRRNVGMDHIAVCQQGRPDTYDALRTVYHGDEVEILSHLVDALPAGDSDFAPAWLNRECQSADLVNDFLCRSEFTALSAEVALIKSLPAGTVLHLSNGMTVRYAQYAAEALHRMGDIYCNRGVSGIDGCTSTAIGTAMVTDGPVVLISGDMSAQYDMGALATAGIPDNFRMAVMNNGGGNIFRHVKSTRDYPTCEECLVGPVRLPLEQLAAAYGLAYFRADDMSSLQTAIPAWLESGGAAVLEIVTDGQRDAKEYRQLIEYVTAKNRL